MRDGGRVCRLILVAVMPIPLNALDRISDYLKFETLAYLSPTV